MIWPNGAKNAPANEKADNEYIMDTYPTQERLATFVQTEQLKKINRGAAVHQRMPRGNLHWSLPRQQNNQDAAYLILSSRRNRQIIIWFRLIIYLPQRMTNTLGGSGWLAGRLHVNIVKFQWHRQHSEPPPPTTTTTTTKSTEPPITDSSGPRKASLWRKTIEHQVEGGEGPSYSGKELPSTNELIRNYYCFSRACCWWLLV